MSFLSLSFFVPFPPLRLEPGTRNPEPGTLKGIIVLLLLIFTIPLIAAGVAYVIRSNWARPMILPVVALAHLVMVFLALGQETIQIETGWLQLDPLGKIVLLSISILFFCCALYAPGYLRLRQDRPNQVFCACLLILLGMMSLVAFTHHLGLMWVAIEATSLASAPLLFFNRTPHSLEAAWKYLLICSVGIALALLGSFFLAYSSLYSGLESTLLFDDLVKSAPQLSKPWLQAAFVTLLVGYGTKMGLAPMHTWKPDAYGEAPGIVGALLAGGVTSCAFIAIFRVTTILNAAQESRFGSKILIGIGLLSMAVAAVFLVRQKDYKRMLAYSSIEHMGILVLGIGLGGPGIFGALLHLLNNAFAKGVLFLSSGNIHRAYGSKSTDQVSGALVRLPASGALFLGGFIAITGSPPFGPFMSEFIILRQAFHTGQFAVAGLALLLLLVIFIGMGNTVLAIVQGPPTSAGSPGNFHDTPQTVLPIILLFLLVLGLGIVLPPPLANLLNEAAFYLEGHL